MEAVSLWKIVEECGLPLESSTTAGTTVTIADPCITRHDRETQGSVRRIVDSIGMTVAELPLSGDKPECCGYGGLMYNANPTLARDVITRRLSQVGAPAVRHDHLAYCAMCRDNLAAGGKRVSHLIEHLFPTVAGGDPAARGWISWSQRRTNRARVSQDILRELGEKGAGSMECYENIRLEMTAEVRRRIDERRILENDIRKVIEHAEQSGQCLRNNQNGQYRACYQPENVTFWVDYTPGDDGRYTIHNAYCHRMKIVGVMK
jgi:Fe-S oxidoreductase